MKEIKNVLLCGLGAIGSIYAVKINNNKNITLKVLVDENRLKRYKKEPLTFNDEEVYFDYILPNDKDFKADLVIIATKNDGFKNALADIKSFVKQETIFLSLLNGLQSEDELVENFGKDNILYSYYIGHTSTRKGRNITHDDVYKTVFGKKENSVLSENVTSVKNFFDETKIKYEIPKDMDYARWWKFLVNVGYNQASAILNATYGVFQTSKKANNYAINLMKEAVELAKAEGVNNTDNLIPEVLKVIETMLPDTKTSMLQDVEAGRKTEVDIFAGYICKLAKKYDIDVPYNKIAYEIISAMDDKIKS